MYLVFSFLIIINTCTNFFLSLIRRENICMFEHLCYSPQDLFNSIYNQPCIFPFSQITNCVENRIVRLSWRRIENNNGWFLFEFSRLDNSSENKIQFRLPMSLQTILYYDKNIKFPQDDMDKESIHSYRLIAFLKFISRDFTHKKLLDAYILFQ